MSAAAVTRDLIVTHTRALKLPGVEVIVLIRAGEMTVQRVDSQAIQTGDFVGAKAEAIHARVDHHVAGAARCGFLPASDLLNAVQNGPRDRA